MAKRCRYVGISKDHDHTDQSDLGRLCSLRSVNTKALDDYGKCQWLDTQWNFYLYYSTVEFKII